MRTMKGGYEQFLMEKSGVPAGAEVGVLPEGMITYIKQGDWKAETAIGGHWDYEDGSNYPEITCAFGVVFPDSRRQPADHYMAEIDARIDDGDLSTGNFRKFGDNAFYRAVIPFSAETVEQLSSL
jgi:hypothetical protein